MNRRIARNVVLACAGLMLGGCSSAGVNLWPFDTNNEQDSTRAPAGATAYQCEGGTRLYVRYLDNGAAAWVILPDREFRLSKTGSASGSQYSNGNESLDVGGDLVTLSDGAKKTHSGCKAASR